MVNRKYLTKLHTELFVYLLFTQISSICLSCRNVLFLSLKANKRFFLYSVKMFNESFYFVYAGTYYAYLFTHTLCFLLLSMQNTQYLHQTEITEDFLYYFIYATQNIHSFYLPLFHFSFFLQTLCHYFPDRWRQPLSLGWKPIIWQNFCRFFSRRSECSN